MSAANGVVIIAFNSDALIERQLHYLNRYRQGDEIIVIDNSSIVRSAVAVAYHCRIAGAQYIRYVGSDNDPSQSHAAAANFAWNKLRSHYERLLFVDHDIFPTHFFSIETMMGGCDIAGLSQEREGLKYLWPGLLAINTAVEDVDFSPRVIAGTQLDTGGGLYELLYTKKVAYFEEVYHDNPAAKDNRYGFFSMIGTWMHFLNGSNWAQREGHTQRINSLFNILQELTP